MGFKHGFSGMKLHDVWRTMIKRCENSNHIGYKYYGGRGIMVCSEWRKDFIPFYNWAIANGYEKGLTIDRINNNGNYEPNNCRFVTYKVQNRNSRNNRHIKIGNEVKLMVDWAEISGIKHQTLRKRIKLGWPGNRLLEPIHK